MSFREKSVWACLATTLLIYGVYFAVAFSMSADEGNGLRIAVMFAAAVATQVIALVVLHSLFAIKSGGDTQDERDRHIQLRAYRNGYVVLGVGVVLFILAMLAREFFSGSDGLSILQTPFMMAHALFFCFVAAEVVNLATQAFYYRRGM